MSWQGKYPAFGRMTSLPNPSIWMAVDLIHSFQENTRLTTKEEEKKKTSYRIKHLP